MPTCIKQSKGIGYLFPYAWLVFEGGFNFTIV